MAAPEQPDLPPMGPPSTDGLRAKVGLPPRRLTEFSDGVPIPPEPDEPEDAEVIDIGDYVVGNPRATRVPPAGGGRRRIDDQADRADRALPNYAAEIYDARPILRAIRRFAHSRATAADSVLLSFLAHVSATVPGGVTIDSGLLSATIPALYVALVGPSGLGKTTSEALARPLADGLEALTLSTGPGALEAFYGPVEEEDLDKKGNPIVRVVRGRAHTNRMFKVGEGSTLYAQLSVEGSTLGGTLRDLWSGTGIGTANATADRNRQLDGGTYNLGAVVGVQTAIAGQLIGDTDTGMAQRFMFASITDPTVDRVDFHSTGPLFQPPAEVRVGQYGRLLRGPIQITVDSAITDELWAGRINLVRGQATVDELDAHRPVQLLKLGAVLAWIESRLHITTDDWTLAKAVLGESDRVRAALVDIAAEQSRDRLVRAGHERAAIRAAETGRDRAVLDVKTRLLDLLGRAEGVMPAGKLKNGVNPRGGKRDLVPDALDLLIGDGSVVETKTDAGNIGYSLSPEARREWS